MTNFKLFVAASVAAAIAAITHSVVAQDDLDDLLKDLDSTPTATAVVEDDDIGAISEAASSVEADDGEDVAGTPDAPEDSSPAGEESAPATAAEEEPAPAAEEEPAPAAEEEPAPAAEEEPAPAAEEEPAPAAEEESAPAAEEEPAPAAEEEPAPAAEEQSAPAAEEESAPAAEEDPAAEEPADAGEPAPATAASDAEELGDMLDNLAGDVSETPAAPETPEPVEEPASEDEPASASEVEAATEEPAAEDITESPEAPETPVVPESPAQGPVEVVVQPPVLDEPPKPDVPNTPPEPVTKDPPKGPAGKDAELIAQLEAAQKIRIEAFNQQAMREIESARASMEGEEYFHAIKHYSNAKNLLNDSPKMSELKKECEQGIAEGLYRAALLEYRTGRRERAFKLMEKAVDRRHPKARRQLQSWQAAGDPDANKVDVSQIKTNRNDDEYKEKRKAIAQHLKRSQQFLSARNLKKALDECELVLVVDPNNQEALRLRHAIEKKSKTIYAQERQASREGMMADVDKAWRPVYAVDAREVEEVSKDTIKTPLGGVDPERAAEQNIIQRMKEMRLPSVSFKPPATIIDAVEFFRQASKDYDRQDLPIEQRGFNFVLKPPEAITASSTASDSSEESSGFGNEEDDSAGNVAISGVPVIPMFSASDLSLYEALKLVCETVKYKFKVQGQVVWVMDENAATDVMITRNYPVLSSFMERMDSATDDMKTMRQSGFGGSSGRREDDGEENKERDWKEIFSLLGVKWPEGSSIMYLKQTGKLRVKNTYENLAELEQALQEIGGSIKLIEIETRFVEVCQEDLNSLGFEWILNSDYSLNMGKHVARALGLRQGAFGESSGQNVYSRSVSSGSSTVSGSTAGYNNAGGTGTAASTTVLTPSTTTESFNSTYNRTLYANSSGAKWIRNGSAHHGRNIGINSFGGDSEYTTGNRYLSTLSNHISGEGYSTNDQFMRLNAFLGGADLSMILHMLSQRSDTDLLSAPKVLTKPGEQAIIKVVTEYIYPTDYEVQLQSSSSGSSGNSGSSQSAILAVVEPQSFTMREVGVILDVTPELTDNGSLIDLKIRTDVVDEPTWKNYGMRIPFTGNSSSIENFTGIGDILTGLADVLDTLGSGLDNTTRSQFADTAVSSAASALEGLTKQSNDNITYYDAPMEQPFFHVRSIQSTVSIFPGSTIVMGGLITEQRKAMDDKVPFLGDIPFIGRLFRSHSEMTNKRNLLIFVTTRLVDARGREMTINSDESETQGVKPAPSEN